MGQSPNIEFARSEFLRGRFSEAERACRQILAGDGNNYPAAYLLGLIARQRGKLELAAKFFARAIAINPNQPDIHNDFGRVCVELGRLDEAVEHLEAALALAPEEGPLHRNLGNLRLEQRRFPEAEASFRRAAAVAPSDPAAHAGLGMALRAQEQFDAAELSFRRAADLDPNDAEIWTNLGWVLHAKGNPDDALGYARRAASTAPGDFVAQNNLGLLLRVLGHLDEAEEFFNKALSVIPRDVGAHVNLGGVFMDRGDMEQATACFRRALALQPDSAAVLNNLGNALVAQGKSEDAIRTFDRALLADPDNPDVLSNLALACRAKGLFERARAVLERVLAMRPGHSMALNNLGDLMLSLGEPRRALEYFRQAVLTRTDYLRAQQNLLFCMNYLEEVAPGDIFREHARLGEEIEARLKPRRRTHSNARNPDRKLKVGYVSGDFFQHPVAHTVEPVLAAHDKNRFDIFCYSSGPTQDEVTERIRSFADHWHYIFSKSDDAVADEIRATGIDILVDLSGHTLNNRLALFARKPAPVQVTWIGYMATTGLKSIDYRITDGFADPPGLTEAFHTETLWRLPSVTIFSPEESPEVNRLPALNGGTFTFGSLNNLSKLTPTVISLWSRILRANPGSRLLLGNVSDDGIRKRLVQQFMGNEISEARLVFKPKVPLADYLKLHGEIDLALDPFPYNGGATSCHSLWMGVPFITLAGDRYMARMGMSLLSNVGLTELIAGSPEEYVELACALVRDLERLAGLRSSLRDRMRRSLCDAAGFTRNLESAYRDMWRRWCNQGPVR